MRTSTDRKRSKERGQVTILFVVSLGIFLLAFVGIATDYTSFWFQRQAVQGAADATCQAAGMDLLLYAEGEQTPNMNFTPSATPVTCSTSSTAAPCIIAKYNGFDGTLAANNVVMSFPATVTGAPPKPEGVAWPYVQVDITTQAKAYFSRLLTRNGTVPVHATATCGLTAPSGPVPILVLHPTDPNTLAMNGTNDAIAVIGGPQKSIQINSINSSAVTGSGSKSLQTVDLSLAGPLGTGGDFGTYGGQATPAPSVQFGSTGSWQYPAAPINDPYRSVDAPSRPAPGTKSAALYGQNGCPDTGSCDEYTAGYYAGGIRAKVGTSIFDPGVYYLGGSGLNLQANSIVRTSTAAGDGSGGVMFYFSGTGTLSVSANSGKPGVVDVYYRDGGTHNGVESRALQCPGGANNPVAVPSTIDGNVLLAPCSGTYGDPTGKYRGFLYFQDRSAAASPQWQGGGTTLAAGFMYFHQCKADGTGLNCSGPGAGGYGTVFGLGGNPGSGSYSIGTIVTDEIYSNGNPGIKMILNPDPEFPLIRVVLIK